MWILSLCGLIVGASFIGSALSQEGLIQIVEVAIPGYPRLPSGAREEGEVQVELTIAPSGRVSEAKAMTGPALLRTSAQAAAGLWCFRPLNQGQPAKWKVTFAFLLKPDLGDPPAVTSIFRPPDRVEVFAEKREVVTIADPPVEDVKKGKKKP